MKIKIHLLFAIAAISFAACQASYEDEIPPYESELVIEAYVNQKYPLLNYAILTQSLDYFNPNIDVDGIKDAKIMVYEGTPNETGIDWESDGVEWIPIQGQEELQGLFMPSEFGFVGKEEHYYKMEISYEDELYTAVSYLPKMVKIDTFYSYSIFNTKRDSNEPFIQMTFKDPVGFGNYYQLYDYRGFQTEEYPPLWGSADRPLLLDDELFDGETFSYGSIFPESYNDTVTFLLTQIDEQAFEFWESYDNSANQGGPFVQPINVKSNFDKGIGIFTALAVDNKQIIITKP